MTKAGDIHYFGVHDCNCMHACGDMNLPWFVLCCGFVVVSMETEHSFEHNTYITVA